MVVSQGTLRAARALESNLLARSPARSLARSPSSPAHRACTPTLPRPTRSRTRSGNGRSGTIGALLIGLAHGLGPVESLELAQKARNDRPGSRGPCPETHEQRMQVR